MLSMHVLACVAMLPSLVVAERFFFGGCWKNFDKYVDPIAHTQQGSMTVNAFFAAGPSKVYLWNPNENEKEFKNVTITPDDTVPVLHFQYSTEDGVTTYDLQTEYQFTPKMMIKLQIPETTPGDGPLGIFSLDKDGIADIYPVYIGSTDLILRGCVDVCFGRVESLYVLTHQDYSSMDADCPIQSIKETYGWDVVVPPQ